MRRTASEVPTTAIEMAKSRATVDESPCDPDAEPDSDEEPDPEEEPDEDEELDEDEDAVPDVVPALLLVCDVAEVVVSDGSRTSKLNYVKSKIFFFSFPEK